MATIQMINDEVIDVTESGDEIASILRRTRDSAIKLEAKDDNGTQPIWVNSAQISSFMG